MAHRRARLVVAPLLLAALPFTWPELGAQVASGPKEAARAWTLPRTPDGYPNLQGYWTNDTYTPLERPAELAGKEFFTHAEAVAFMKSRVDRLLAQSKDDIHYDDAIWQAENYAKKESLRTSLIVEPRNGQLPALTEAGQKRLAQQRATQRASAGSESARHRSLAERCISWGNVGPPMIPPTYYANLQIIQTHDQVVIRHELMDHVRVIHLDGRPHPGPEVRWLAGHSIGRWEGDTLVVDTTNFSEQTNFRGSPQNTRQDIFATAALHVVERFTRVRPDAVHYAFTVDDPDTWTARWVRGDGDQIGRRAHLRVRLPRRKLRPCQHPERRACHRGVCGHAVVTQRAVHTIRRAAIISTMTVDKANNDFDRSVSVWRPSIDQRSSRMCE